MNRRTFIVGCTVAMATGMLLSRHEAAEAANALNYVESVRVHSAVVYVGVANKVEVLARSQFGLSAEATVTVQTVARGQMPTSGMASLRYSTYDETTPANDGGLQYKIAQQDWVLVFADSFEQGSPSALWRGNPAEIIKVIKQLADSLEKMQEDDLAFNGISQQDRVSQMALYQSLLRALQYTGLSMRVAPDSPTRAKPVIGLG